MDSVTFTDSYITNWTRKENELFNKEYGNNDKCGVDQDLATLEFEIQMKTEHDPKGKFSIGFLIIDENDGEGVKLGIFDDDRKIIGIFRNNKHAIKIMDKILETRKSRHIFTYKIPNDIKNWRVEEQKYGTKRVMIHEFNQKYLDGFQLSKDILEKGSLADHELTKGWREEN